MQDTQTHTSTKRRHDLSLPSVADHDNSREYVVPNSDGLQPNSDGLQPTSDGLQPSKNMCTDSLSMGAGCGTSRLKSEVRNTELFTNLSVLNRPPGSATSPKVSVRDRFVHFSSG